MTVRVCRGCEGEIPSTRAPQARYCSEGCKSRHNGAIWRAENLELNRERQRDYAKKAYASDPAKAISKKAKWRADNIEKARAAERARYQKKAFGKPIDSLPYGEAKKLMTGLKHGFRSGLEDKVSQQLTEAGVPVIYEQDKLRYEQPATSHTYTPDFRIDRPDGSFFYVETKGRFETSDRKKHLHVQRDNPDVEIRFVFSNSKARISKTSKTTYAMWCEKYGFQFADKLIPEAWLKEKRKKKG